jgi:hypothetical protein
MFAKSLFNGAQVFSSKSILNPVNYYYQQKAQTMYGTGANFDPCSGSNSNPGNGSGSGTPLCNIQLSPPTVTALDMISVNYVKNLANRLYPSIPNSEQEYLLLHGIVANEITSQTNTNLKKLLQLAIDGLTGSRHGRTLNEDNVDLNLQVLLLNRKVDDILSKKNEVTAMGGTSGEFVITKTFKLAPLYSYYIFLYGMPAYGVGFEPSKLNILAGMLQKYNINPYA